MSETYTLGEKVTVEVSTGDNSKTSVTATVVEVLVKFDTPQSYHHGIPWLDNGSTVNKYGVISLDKFMVNTLEPRTPVKKIKTE